MSEISLRPGQLLGTFRCVICADTVECDMLTVPPHGPDCPRCETPRLMIKWRRVDIAQPEADNPSAAANGSADWLALSG